MELSAQYILNLAKQYGLTLTPYAVRCDAETQGEACLRTVLTYHANRFATTIYDKEVPDFFNVPYGAMDALERGFENSEDPEYYGQYEQYYRMGQEVARLSCLTD